MSVLKLVVGGPGCLFLGLGLGDVWQAVGALGGARRALQTLCNTCRDTLTLRQLTNQFTVSVFRKWLHAWRST